MLPSAYTHMDLWGHYITLTLLEMSTGPKFSARPAINVLQNLYNGLKYYYILELYKNLQSKFTIRYLDSFNSFSSIDTRKVVIKITKNF